MKKYKNIFLSILAYILSFVWISTINGYWAEGHQILVLTVAFLLVFTGIGFGIASLKKKESIFLGSIILLLGSASLIFFIFLANLTFYLD